MQQDSTPSPVQGALFYTAKMLLLMTVGLSIQQAFGNAGAVANQLLFSVGLAVAFVLYNHQGAAVRGVLRLRRISAFDMVKSVGLGLVALGLIQVLGALASTLVQRAGGALPEYYNFARTPFVLAVVTHAIMPAICEEIAYRGYLQHSLSPLGPRAAVVVTALLFGATHFSVIRLLPLALLGLIFSAVVRRAESVYPSMIMHLVNNGTVLALTYYGAGIPSVSTLGVPVLLGLAVVLGLAVWGLIRSFGVEAGVPVPAAAPVPRSAVGAMAAVLVPALLLYAYAVSAELHAVFGSNP
ncbi:MAG TPA: type II CAAX endopeptidase family protein [Symbiobacteriaceae bacterium]|nr:type II CAAX endopeptidase family protein [Symbiobacteriaceae bacterium]